MTGTAGHYRDMSGTRPATPYRDGTGHTPIGVSHVPVSCPAQRGREEMGRISFRVCQPMQAAFQAAGETFPLMQSDIVQ